jgi:hypothetical protein
VKFLIQGDGHLKIENVWQLCTMLVCCCHHGLAPVSYIGELNEESQVAPSQQIIRKSIETPAPCDHVEFQKWKLNYFPSLSSHRSCLPPHRPMGKSLFHHVPPA